MLEFNAWPEHNIPGLPIGPLYEEQRLLWFDQLPAEKRRELNSLGLPKGHDHPVSYDLMQGGKGSGKCWQKGTTILFFDGSIKPVEEIKVGDLLMGPDSKPRRVESLARGREMMYTVQPTKGESFGCNESHILVLKTSGLRTKHLRLKDKSRVEITSTGEVKVMTAGEFFNLSKKLQNCYKLFHSEQIKFPNPQQLELDPYYLGLWLGDGTAINTNVTTMDPEIVEFLQKFAIKNNIDLVRQDKSGKAYTYCFTNHNHGGLKGSNKILSQLQHYNLIQNKHIPFIYKTASVEDRLHLLAGLVDSDGHSSNNGAYYEISQKNKQLAEDIVFLIRSLGFACYLKKIQKYCIYKGEKRTGTYYRINFWGDLNQIPVILPRKKVTKEHSKFKDPLVTGLKLNQEGEGEYYGFTLSGPDRLFLLGDFIVAHNTQAAVARCIECALQYEGCEILVGAKELTQLDLSAKKAWRERFTLPGSLKEWNHPLVIHKPTDKDKRLLLRTWTTKCKKPGHQKGCWDGKPSTVWFLHFDDDEHLRGVNADIIHIEEACLIADRKSYTELITRLRGKACPFRQVILTTNPENSRGWLSEVFGLYQFSPNYKGPSIPIGPECNCQFCQTCLNFGKGEWLYDENGICTNPECAFMQYTPAGKDPNEFKAKKDNKCPGSQRYHRVIFVATHQNPALPSEAVQTMLGGMSKAEAQSAIFGKQVYLTEGKVFYAFDPAVNIVENTYDLNPREPACLFLDFNINPECSILVQDKIDRDGAEFPVGLDEFILWKSSPAEVGGAVGKHLSHFGFSSTLLIYGDPNGLNGDTKNNLGLYKALMDGLDLHNIKWKMMVPDNSPISVYNSAQNANTIFKNAKDESRFFINKRCEWTILSLQETEWDPKGRGSINKQCDQNAYNLAKANNFIVEDPIPLTHPGEAIRYGLALRYPILMKKKAPRMLQIPGEIAIRQDAAGKVREVVRRPKEKKRDAFDSGSIREMLREMGQDFYQTDSPQAGPIDYN